MSRYAPDDGCRRVIRPFLGFMLLDFRFYPDSVILSIRMTELVKETCDKETSHSECSRLAHQSYLPISLERVLFELRAKSLIQIFGI